MVVMSFDCCIAMARGVCHGTAEQRVVSSELGVEWCASDVALVVCLEGRCASRVQTSNVTCHLCGPWSCLL